ncbi:MAG: VOC family protein [Thermomicrobiales bacterium]|nr:VOC family protein [Thermomicrobiales bacterium]
MPVNPRFGFALEYVADVAAAKRFYTEVLGLEVERDHPVFVQFRDPSGAFFAIASDEALSEGANPELYWLVDDAEAAARELAARTEITHPLRQTPFGSVFGVTDPDGQPRFLVELARERPSRRVS